MTLTARVLHATWWLALTTICATSAAGTREADARLLQTADRFFDTYFLPEQPTTATALGVHRYDDKLEDYSRAGVDASIKALHGWEKEFAAVDQSQLSEAVRGDAELLLNSVRSELQMLEVIRPWQTNPDMYSSGITASAFSLMERSFAPPDVRLRLLIAREKTMPAVLDAARANLSNPPRIFTEIALEQMPGLVAFFRKDVPSAFASVSDMALQQQFAASNGAVVDALGRYETWLRKTLLPRSKGDFRIGAAEFQKKLAYDEMVDTPLAQLLALDLENMHANQRDFQRIAHELDPDKTTAQVIAAVGANHPAPDRLLAAFQDTLKGLVSFIQTHHIITIPSLVPPILEETPPFMRATTSASMDTPGPFEPNAKEAYFNVTLPDPLWSAGETNDFMAQFSYPVISSTATHETYPGHYTQFLWMFDVHDRVRKILSANSNAEGWAHYCEQMMLDEGLAEALYPNNVRQQKLLRLGQLQDALLRNARFYVGIKMHTGGMTLKQAEEFFVNEGYQAPAVAKVETKRGTSNPTYLYYTLGKLEIQKLRRDVAAKQGSAFSLQAFHDNFMREGAPPIRIVRRAMLHDDSPAL